MNLSQLKCVFIDFDGTLIDSVPMLYEHYVRFLKNFEREGSLEEFKSLMGPTINEFIPILIQLHQLENDPEKLSQLYLQNLSQSYKKVELMDGALEFLKLLQELKIPAVLVTSSPSALIEASLESLKIKSYFKSIITGELVKKTKPDPEIYLLALSKTNCQPQETLAIEDSFNGISAALDAKIPTIALQAKKEDQTPADAIHVNNWHQINRLIADGYVNH